jgi:hypothetical protein
MPGVHATQEEAEAAMVRLLKVPGAQSVGLDDPIEQYAPDGHGPPDGPNDGLERNAAKVQKKPGSQ